MSSTIVNDQGVIIPVEDSQTDTISTSAIMKRNAPGTINVLAAPSLTVQVKGNNTVDLFPDGVKLYNQDLALHRSYVPTKISRVESGTFNFTLNGAPVTKGAYTLLNDIVWLTIQDFTLPPNTLSFPNSFSIVGIPVKLQPLGYWSYIISTAFTDDQSNARYLTRTTLGGTEPAKIFIAPVDYVRSFDTAQAITVAQVTLMYYLNTSY